MKYSALLSLLILFAAACGDKRQEDSIVVGDTITTESGLKYSYTKVGTGRPVETGSKVWTYLALSVDGKEVWNTDGPPDSSFVFVANKDRMIKGFTEVTMKLREGDEIIAILPPHLAYKEAGSPPVIPPNATLVYTKYVMKRVNEPKLSLSDTLFAAYQKGGHEAMLTTRSRIMSSPDTANYYYDDGQWRILWNLLTDSDMHEQSLQMIDYANTKNESGMRWYRVRTYEKMGNHQLAYDSLKALLKSDTAMASNNRTKILMEELEEKLKK